MPESQRERVRTGVTIRPEFAKSDLTSPGTAFCVLNHSLDCYCSASEDLKQKLRDTVTTHVQGTPADNRLPFREVTRTATGANVRTGVAIRPAQRPHALNLSHPPGSTVCPGCGFEYAGQPFCPNCGYKV